MKIKRSILIIPLVFLLACNKETIVSSSLNSVSSSSSTSQDSNMTLDELVQLLEGDVYVNEVMKSNKVVFEETDKRGDSRVSKEKETLTIYSDFTSFATGEKSNEYNSSGKETKDVDTYQMINQAITYVDKDNTSSKNTIYYRVIDYKDGNKNSIWVDSAYRLPVVNEGNEGENGVNYLLVGSLPGQISKQVSLLSSRFIKANLTGNPDVMMALPKVKITKENSNTIYSINEYKYSYNDDDGSTTEVLVKFAFTLDDKMQLITSDTTYQTTTSSYDEVYVENLHSHYDVSYGERVSSTTVSNLINPEDYFIQTVEEVRAYVYNNGKKEEVDFKNLPINSLVHFEAKKYTPLKAVDLEMKPVSSSNTTAIKVDSNVFDTLASGESTLKMESVTGVEFTLDVRVNIPSIKSISYVDTYSNIEIDKQGDVVNRYIYTNTTYTNINVSPRPNNALVSDIEIVVSDESVLQVTKDESASTLNNMVLKYKVLKNNENKSVTVTFRLKDNQQIATSITYNIKDRLSKEDFVTKITTHAYRWSNIYGSGYSLFYFESNQQGKVQYYGSDGNSLGNSIFSYTLTYDESGISFTISMTSYYQNYNYDQIDMKLDGESFIAWAGETAVRHDYVIQEGTL